MKILFIYPNAGSQLGFNYGIAHLSAVLKKLGHEVSLWQLCDDIEPLPSKEKFIARLRRESPDIIGFSVVTNQWTYAKKLASAFSLCDARLFGVADRLFANRAGALVRSTAAALTGRRLDLAAAVDAGTSVLSRPRRRFRAADPYPGERRLARGRRRRRGIRA